MKHRAAARVWHLTVAAWASLVVFAATSSLLSVSLERIGSEFSIGFGPRGALAGIRALVLASATLVIGRLADRFGTKWFISGAMVVIAVGLVWSGSSPTYVWLVGGIAVMAVGLGGLEALVSPLVAELHPRNVATHLSVLHAFFPAGLVVCSFAIGRALDSGVHWQVPFRVAAIPSLLVGVLFLTGRYADGPAERRVTLGIRAIAAMPLFWILAAVIMLGAGCEGTLIYWTPNFIQAEYGTAAVVGAAGLVLLSLAMTVGRLGVGIAARRLPLESMMMYLALVGAVASGCFALVDGLWASMGLLMAAGLCVACFWPCTLALAARHIATGSATLFAMLSVTGILGFGALPYASGLIAEKFGLRVGLCLVPAAFVAATFALLMSVRLSRRPTRARAVGD